MTRHTNNGNKRLLPKKKTLFRRVFPEEGKKGARAPGHKVGTFYMPNQESEKVQGEKEMCLYNWHDGEKPKRDVKIIHLSFLPEWDHPRRKGGDSQKWGRKHQRKRKKDRGKRDESRNLYRYLDTKGSKEHYQGEGEKKPEEKSQKGICKKVAPIRNVDPNQRAGKGN